MFPTAKNTARYTCVMNVREASKALGVSERRVRALIGQGKLQAQKIGHLWEIQDPNVQRASRRPLSEHSRVILTQALHQRSLGNLTGQERARTAARVRELRSSADPSALLIDWWGGKLSGPLNFGTNLVQHALAGNSSYVAQALQQPRREYLRSPHVLADIVSSERLIRGLTRTRLAQEAQVLPEQLIRIEHSKPLNSPGSVRRILRVLDIEPTALPMVAA